MRDEPRLVTQSVAAAFLGTSISTLRIWRNRRIGPPWSTVPSTIPGNRDRVMYSLDRLTEWMKAKQTSPEQATRQEPSERIAITLTPAQWRMAQPILLDHGLDADGFDRTFIEIMLSAAAYGIKLDWVKHTQIKTQAVRWQALGVWTPLFKTLTADPDFRFDLFETVTIRPRPTVRVSDGTSREVITRIGTTISERTVNKNGTKTTLSSTMEEASSQAVERWDELMNDKAVKALSKKP